MGSQVCRITLGTDKLRNERDVKALQMAVETVGLQVRSLVISVDSLNLHTLAVQQQLLESPYLSGLESLALRLNFSLGATCLGVLAKVIEAGHVPLLHHLSISYRYAIVSETDFSQENTWSSISQSMHSLPGPHSSQSSLSISRSQPSSSTFRSQTFSVEDSYFLTDFWEGFALLARALSKNLLSKLGKTVSLNSNWGSRNLGDVGVKHLAELIATGYFSHLKVLDFQDNFITNDGMKALAGALGGGNMVALEVLNLNKNIFHQWTSTEEVTCLEVVREMEADHLPSLKWIGLSGAGHWPDGRSVTNVADAVVAAFTRNTSLIADVEMDWPNKSLQGRWNAVRERNLKLTRILQELEGQVEVPVTNGKLFICGFPGTGKTTLRASLRRNRFQALIQKERKPCHRIATRGIEVTKITEISRSRVTGTKFSLRLWDLAGQEDFHVLHSSFLPDLGLANGRGTTFVVVFDARYNRAPTESASAEDELVYWLRFIASNSIIGVKRKVLVVLNTFNGASCTEKAQWTELLKCQHEKYEDFLDISTDPFVLDARVARSVSQLKQALFQHTKTVLQNLKWPRICQYIQENLEVWSTENQEFPIVHWHDFEGKMAASKLGPKTLEAAIEYLHESGDVIYFRRGSLVESGNPDTKLIVLNPEWFCKRIVGQLLLPEGMLDAGETPLKKSVAPDGSLGIREITAYFKELLTSDHHVNYVLGMLIRLGLCYKVGQEKVLIPVLIEDDELPVQLWTRKPEQEYCTLWMVGRSLVLKDSERTALPKAVFRRLQVQLAQDPELGGLRNSEYAVGKSFATFKKSGLSILVQFDVDDSDPRDDRVDVIATPLVSREKDVTKQRKQQINLVEKVMARMQQLCLRWCPGIEFDEKIILPWRASDGVLPILERNAQLSVHDTKMWLKQNWLRARLEDHSELNWFVGEDAVTEEEVLSSSEIHELQLWAEAKSNELNQLVTDLDMMSEKSSQQDGSQDKDRKPSSTDLVLEEPKRIRRSAPKQKLPRLHLKIEKEAQEIRNHIDKTNLESRSHIDVRLNEVIDRTTEVGDHFRKALHMQKLVLRQIQDLARFSVEELESSIPRFIYLADKEQSGIWLTMQQAFVERRSKLHLLCEARYNDGGLHEVEGQKGLEITQLKEWASMLAPWLERSLKAAIVAAKIVGGIFIPGLNLLLPDFHNKDGRFLSAAITTGILNYIPNPSIRDNHDKSMAIHTDVGTSTSASSASEINAKAKFILQKLLRDSNATLGPGILEHFGLQRVILTDPHDHSRSSVLWLCLPCCRKYGRLARHIS